MCGASFGFGERDSSVAGHGTPSAMCGACGGAFVVFIAITLLAWNELAYLNSRALFGFVSDNTYEYTSCAPEQSKDGQPIFASCPLVQLHDFAAAELQGRLIFANAKGPPGPAAGLWFEAASEIFQWTERKECKDEAVASNCNYFYEKRWMSAPIDSSFFYCIRSGISSPGCPGSRGKSIAPPVNEGSIPAILQGVSLAPHFTAAIGGPTGKFFLNSWLLRGKPFGARPIHLDEPLAKFQRIPPGLKQSKKVFSYLGYTYFADAQPGVDASDKSVGDLRSNFTVSDVTLDGKHFMSIIGQQINSQAATADVEQWTTGKTGSLSVVNWVLPEKREKSDFIGGRSTGYTMELRFGGWALMLIGLQFFLGPVALAPQMVPWIGSILGDVSGCALLRAVFFLSASFSLLVIGLIGVLARPLLSLLLILCAALVYLLARTSLRITRTVRASSVKDRSESLSSLDSVQELSSVLEGAETQGTPPIMETTEEDALERSASSAASGNQWRPRPVPGRTRSQTDPRDGRCISSADDLEEALNSFGRSQQLG